MDGNQRRFLDDQDWDHLLEKLTLHALEKLRRRFWRGEWGGMPPGGTEAADFASEAITDTYSGERSWNRDRHPDLINHLRSAVDSLISNAVRSSANKDRWADDEQLDLFSGTGDADIVFKAVSDREFVEGFMTYIHAETDLCAVVRCVVAGHLKREDIAEQTGMTASEVTNCGKRLARRLTDYSAKVYGPGRTKRKGATSRPVAGQRI